MKKTLTMFLAAAAVLAGCSKIEEQKVDPNTASENSFFYGSIEQPSDPTRTTLDESNGVQWEKGDTITAYRLGASVFADTTVKMVFYAENEGSASFFSAKDISAATEFHKALDGTGYDVYFGTKDTIPCIPSSIKKYESGSVRHLPMHAKVAAGVYGPGQRKAVFNNVCAVLKVTFPAGSIVTSNKLVVSAEGEDKIAGNYYMGESGLTLISDGSSQTITYSFTAASEERVFYIPVAPGEHQLTFSAKEGNSDKRTIRMTKAVKLEANYIYPINFTEFNYEIKAETTEINLPSNSGKVNITVKENNSQNLVIKYSDPASANHPTIVNIDADGFTVSNLTINLPSSHVELSNGTGVNIVSQTSQNTLVVNDGFNVTGDITIKKGNLEVHGSVSKVTIDEDVAQIVKITADDNKVTTIENKSSVKADISAEGANVTGNEGGNFSCGGNRYLYLAEAFAAASSGATVTVENSCTVDKAASVESGKTITLDLNGKSLNSGGKNARISVDGGSLTIQSSTDGGQIFQEDTVDAHTIMVNAGSLTVKSGSISSSKSAAIYVPENLDNSGSPINISLQGCTIAGESESTGAVAVNDNSYATLSIENATVKSTTSRCFYLGTKATATISSGTFTSSANTISYYAAKENEEDANDGLIISGGKFSTSGTNSRVVGVYGSKNISISGGSFYSAQSYTLYGYTAGSAKVAITGDDTYFYTASQDSKIGTVAVYSGSGVTFSINNGYYNKSTGITDERLAKGYQCLFLEEPVSFDGNEYDYKVMQPSKNIISVKVGDSEAVNYKTVTAATDVVNAADNKDQEIYVTLLDDITLASENFLIKRAEGTSGNKLVTLDLGGYTLTTQHGDSKRLNLEDYSNVLVKNGRIYTDVSSYCLKSTNNTNVTINSDVTIESKNYTAYNIASYSVVTLDGCKIVSGSTSYAVYINNKGAQLTIKSGTEIYNTSTGLAISSSSTKISAQDGVKARPYIPSIALSSSQWQEKYATGDEYLTVRSDAYSGDDETFFECIPMSFSDALTKANTVAAASTIKLLKNVNLEASASIQNTSLKKITLDLNGNNISCGGTENNQTLRVFTDIEIKDNTSTPGTVDAPKTGGRAIYFYDSNSSNDSKRSWTISGGNFTGSNQYGVIRATGGSSTLTISGGSFINGSKKKTTDGYAAIHLGYSTSTTCKIKISGGQFESKNEVLRRMYGYLEVTGGKFKAGADQGIVTGTIKTDDTQFVSIKGGLFSQAPSDDAIPSTHEIVDNTDTETKTDYKKKVQQKN